jgi:hypothetical protein
MTAAPKCDCGAALPDARAKFCDTCRGKRVKEQENARKLQQVDRDIGDVEWAYVGIAVRMKLEEIRTSKPIEDHVREIATEQASVPDSVIPAACAGRALRPANFRRICAWLGRPMEDFKRVGSA